MPRIRRPIHTSLLDTIRQHPLLQQRQRLNSINIQTRANMPRNMAMERPHARIIRIVLQDDISRSGRTARLDDLHVATLRVGLMGYFAVPGADAFGEDVEIVAVEMHGVGGWEFVLDDEADGAVVAEVVDVPLGIEWIGDVALVGEDEDRVTWGKGTLMMGKRKALGV